MTWSARSTNAYSNAATALGSALAVNCTNVSRNESPTVCRIFSGSASLNPSLRSAKFAHSIAPAEDGLWGAKGATNVFAYIKQNNNREPVSKIDGDLEGPFDVAVTASKGDGKIVVVGSAGFAFDEIAFAAELVQSASGFTVRSRNPGNVTLLINSLHWLNDNTAFMNIGQPIDVSLDQSYVLP